jgi:signal peptidase II
MPPRNLGLALAAVIFVVDQASKWCVTGPLGLEAQGDILEIIPIFRFWHTHNSGVSLSLFTADTDTKRWALVAVTGGIALFVLRWLWKERNRRDALALGAILGGALGNVLDRARLGHVTDFLDLHFGEFRPFLIFNVADTAITIGVLVLVAGALFTRDSKAADAQENEHA